MTLTAESIASVLFHFAGMVLMTLAFIEMALIVKKFSQTEVESVCFPGTMLPMYPLLITIGGLSFVYLTFAFLQVSLMPDDIALEFEPKLRYIGTGITLVGGLLALYGIYKFNLQLKLKEGKI
ncbi:MAG TPA: hypothetical protein VFF13_03130 [archaeon]|nr:hypothetical protein [archaeon]